MRGSLIRCRFNVWLVGFKEALFILLNQDYRRGSIRKMSMRVDYAKNLYKSFIDWVPNCPPLYVN